MAVVNMSTHSSNSSPQSYLPSIGNKSPDARSNYGQQRLDNTVGNAGPGSINLNFDGANNSPPRGIRGSSGIGLPRLTDRYSSDSRSQSDSEEKRQKLLPKVQQMAQAMKLRYGEELPKEFNPEPLPYQPQVFKSSTMLRMVSVPPRHQDMFGTPRAAPALPRQKGLIVHSERYQWYEKPQLESLSQRERMRAEQEYMEKMRGIKRKREILTHREHKDLLMGGKPAQFTERFDVTGELQRLKSIVLPVNARDLYHGKGIQLPQNHSSMKPRHRPIPPADSPTSRTSMHRVPKPTPVLTESEQEDEMDANHWSEKQKEQTSPTRRPESEMEIDIPSVEPTGQSLAVANSASPMMNAATPNPLKGADLSTLVSNEEKNLLSQAFEKLDTDKDGHLTYNQVKNIIPKDVTVNEEKFLKQIYDITSSSTFFGLNEFVTISCLCQEMAKLSGPSKDAFDKIPFPSLQESITQYVELFQSVDRKQTGCIALNSLEELLSTTLEKDRTVEQETFQEIHRVVNPEMDDTISKVKFLAHVPYFLTFEPR